MASNSARDIVSPDMRPTEWWIREPASIFKKPTEQTTRVIEHSAYEYMKKKFERNSIAAGGVITRRDQMSADDKFPFPLCRQAGLEASATVLSTHPDYRATSYIETKDVEALLANAPVVNTRKADSGPWKGQWVATSVPNCDETHSARLLLIEPIQQKTREEEMEELLNTFVERTKHYGGDWDLVEQAKKILNKRKK